jgi:riboflavin synthase
MFTGIVETLGRVGRLETAGDGRRLRVAVPDDPGWRLGLGESVAVSGVCLTVVDAPAGELAFDLAEETLRVTTLGGLGVGDPVNLERPLRFDGRLGGHLVLGHVDGVGRVAAVRPEGEGARVDVEVPAGLRPLLIPKGSVTVDGVSLTVAALDAEAFAVALIPHTLAVTTLGRRRPGDPVNLEMDVIGKYVRGFVQLWQQRQDWQQSPQRDAARRDS